jgi:hypothetical protein
MHFNKQQYDNFHDKQDKGQVQPEPWYD